MKHGILDIGLLAFTLFSCKSKKAGQNVEEVELGIRTETSKEGKTPSEEPQENCLELLDISDFKPDQEDLMAGILESRISGDCLIVKFQYSGCNEGKPLLIKKPPVESKKGFVQNLDLLVRGAGPCEMLLEASESFDISSLKQGPETLTIRVNDQKEINYRAY